MENGLLAVKQKYSMKIEYYELILVSIIVLIQLIVFTRTFSKIRLFRRIIPSVKGLLVTKLFVPAAELEELSPKQLLENLSQYKEFKPKQSAREDLDENVDLELFDIPHDGVEDMDITEVNIIESNDKANYVFENVLFSINNYLIRNRGAATDFHLIKDIVERNTDAIEQDISLSVGIPLYLGLMGTMMGIVIALFNMPDLAVDLGG